MLLHQTALQVGLSIVGAHQTVITSVGCMCTTKAKSITLCIDVSTDGRLLLVIVASAKSFFTCSSRSAALALYTLSDMRFSLALSSTAKPSSVMVANDEPLAFTQIFCVFVRCISPPAITKRLSATVELRYWNKILNDFDSLKGELRSLYFCFLYYSFLCIWSNLNKDLWRRTCISPPLGARG